MAKRVIIENIARKGEPNNFDRQFWQQAGPEAIWAAMAEMVEEVNLIRGQNAGESRLQRTVEHIERRKR